MKLSELQVGRSATVKAVGDKGQLRQHFLDMGLIPGVMVKLIKLAPMGDPMELRIFGYELTLRKEDACKIEIEETDENNINEEPIGEIEPIAPLEHPGLGETGKYHDKSSENPLPKGTVLTFALAGNQNSGKTILFNQLTGSNQHVGNFPGVTVDKKSGSIIGYEDTEITDLPGIYSMSPYSNEEIVTRNFILQEKPKGIINIVDATNIERNLYLTMQLMTLEVPMVLALNMMDEVEGNGGSIDINRMEEILGIPVVPISAAKNQGVDELVRHALHVAKYQEKPARTDFCGKNDDNGAVHRGLHAIMHLIEDHAARAGIPVRFAATKLIEGDNDVLRQLSLSENEKEMLEHIICQLEDERGLDRTAAIADMRFDFIRKVVSQTVQKPNESKESVRSSKIDKILTGRFTAIPSFVLIMAAIFYLTFDLIGGNLQNLFQYGIDRFSNMVEMAFESWNVNAVVTSLVVDGILNGVGTVVSFLPIIVILFLFLSLLEDSGYMARIAFVMDRPLRRFGLSGKSIVPMLVGFGCTVPGIMSARTLSSDRDRRMTILLLPFISCSAKLPIYGFLARAFFPDYAALIIICMYFLGIFTGILISILFKDSLFKGKPVPFVMELPNYRMPSLKNVGMLLWEKIKDFLQRAFTIIMIATIIIWFLGSFDIHLNMVSDSQTSMLSAISGFIAPIFKPLGFGDWRICTALISGFLAKESVVSSLNVLFGTTQAMASVITPLAALSLLVFCLLYTPCVAAISSVRRELGRRWALYMVVGQCLVAWVVAFIVRLIGLLLGAS